MESWNARLDGPRWTMPLLEGKRDSQAWSSVMLYTPFSKRRIASGFTGCIGSSEG